MKKTLLLTFALTLAAALCIFAGALEPVDVSDVTPVYFNDFDSDNALVDFEQFYGTWEVIGGRVYLTDVESVENALLIYSGSEALKNLTDYVVDVDMYNAQTQGGVLIRSKVDAVDGKMTGSDFRGYFAFVSYTGARGAIGLGKPDGHWGGNLVVGNSDVTAPGANVHIQAAVKGDVITYTLSDVNSKNTLWTDTVTDSNWSKGSFGFRLCTKAQESGTDNVSATAFDNLVVSTFNSGDKEEGVTFNDQRFMYSIEHDLAGEPVTVEAVVRFAKGSTSTDMGTFFGNYHWDTTTHNIDFGVGTKGYPEIRIRNNDTVFRYVFNKVNVCTGDWVHLTLVRDVANGVARCYVDGELAQIVTMTDVHEPLATWDYMIGANVAYMNPDYFKGELKSLAVYSDIRTETEIAVDTVGFSDDAKLLVAYEFHGGKNRPDAFADLGGSGNSAVRNRMFFDGEGVDREEYAYTFAVLGDTQNMAKNFPDYFGGMYEYIYDNIEEMNIEAVLGLGDITDTRDGENTEKEWEIALAGHKIIDDAVLNIPITGDHDSPYWYNKTIANLNYADIVTRYRENDLRNGYIKTEIGGIPYLFIQFQKGPDDKVLAWADKVVEDNPDYNVIITTHGYLYHDRTTMSSDDNHLLQMFNLGDEMWDKFVSKHENIVMILCGHIGHDYAVVNQRKGEKGNTVTEILLDFQSCDNAARNYGLSENGLGVVNLFHFTEDGKEVIIETVSTVLGKHFMDRNQIRVELDTVSSVKYEAPDRDPLPERTPSAPITPKPEGDGKETVIYSNDFSDPATLSDFTQYRVKWEIRDGGLYMTDKPLVSSYDADNLYGHILYNNGRDLNNYVLDVDFHNVRTQSGVIVRSMQEYASNSQNDFAGYLAFVSNDLTQGATASSSLDGWSDVLATGFPTSRLFYGADIHLNIIVKNNKIGVKITNIDSGKLIYDNVYTIGTNLEDDYIFTDGTFGFRMRAKNGTYVGSNASYFDNLVVTTADYAVPAVTPVTAEPIDFTNVTAVYNNTFDNANSLGDFKQFYGTWEVRDGKLCLTDVGTASDALCIYNGDKFKNLKNYVVDVDMYNVQTQGGVIIRSDVDSITGELGGSDFRGYATYLSYSGEKAAIGMGNLDGSWAGNIATSDVICAPGANLHLRTAVKGDVITYIVTDKASGEVLWDVTAPISMWEQGSFGFRLNAKVYEGVLSNVETVKFDNLVVSMFPEDIEHDCTYGDWTVRTYATASSAGEKYRLCTFCGKEDSAVIPMITPRSVDIVAERVAVTAGETCTVDIVIENNEGYKKLNFEIDFDTTVLKLVSIDKNKDAGSFVVNTVNNANSRGTVTFKHGGSSNVYAEGRVATLTFATKIMTVDLEAAIDVICTDGDAAYLHEQGTTEELTVNTHDGFVRIEGIVPPLGDVDLDGTVELEDCVMLIRAILNGETLENADMNGDGKLSLADVLLQMKKI